MRLVVIIATLGRKEQLARLLEHLERQERLPDEVIVSAPDEEHVEVSASHRFPISMVFGRRGLCAQRNHALNCALERFDVVTFFDDDFIPQDNYLQLLEEAFQEHQNWAVVMGHVVKDGAQSAGLSWAEALQVLATERTQARLEPKVVDHVGAYGCNMSIRASLVGDLRFDERLALYGWQEDIDFTSQLRRVGRVVGLNTLRGIHLGLKIGRVSGERFGYSQVANPIYLIRKGTVPASFALPLMGRNIAANLVRSIWPEPYVDRRGRLRGNLIALGHVLKGRVEPEYIQNMAVSEAR
ncbi:glycosyltransferase family 2 protein [Sinorhizobium fredii]|uniref:glycosyltransferase family 2 protein n=1 Tax=Rhizobium fredii TaxID=380 RepID=UPI001295EB4A|nr:glycosyltransferase [Sinorhizobium fredii]MQW94247.1 glycosyltransferase [Sinorhizobium fredii]MQW95512.1 glycosyltransferase [Sinorhizobium fredii]UTY46181.1 glycosyltransferase [Sinorhizobium fredii]